ncbi:MAG: hypothetical protein FD183_837, partial [Chitinophagaceae bacterium]
MKKMMFKGFVLGIAAVAFVQLNAQSR